jgi:hypothetical protein
MVTIETCQGNAEIRGLQDVKAAIRRGFECACGSCAFCRIVMHILKWECRSHDMALGLHSSPASPQLLSEAEPIVEYPSKSSHS